MHLCARVGAGRCETAETRYRRQRRMGRSTESLRIWTWASVDGRSRALEKTQTAGGQPALWVKCRINVDNRYLNKFEKKLALR